MGYRKIIDGAGKEVTKERVLELFEYLTAGTLPEGITCPSPRLSKQQAGFVVYFLQEQLEILPDWMEQCCKCGDLFNDEAEGLYIEETGQYYCESCAYVGP